MDAPTEVKPTDVLDSVCPWGGEGEVTFEPSPAICVVCTIC